MWLREGTLLACLGLAVGCGGSTGSSGPAPFKVKAVGTGAPAAATAGGVTSLDGDGTALTLASARINLREIRLDLADGTRCADVAADLTAPARCEDGSGSGSADAGTDDVAGTDDSSGSAEIRLEGPFVVDLITGASTPDLSQVRVPATTYRRIEFRVDDTESAQALADGDPLQGMSFAATFGFTDQDGAARTLQVALNFNEDHRIEPEGGVTVSGDGGELLLMLDAQKWLETIPVATCLAEGDLQTDGELVFLDEHSGGACGDVENVLKDNIKGSEQLQAR